ncbi:MAG: vitamin B12-dependent ribonucleotide reductase [Chloroflexi bacterium]|nr:vitamin B12-dependent ribonucleotide reductase [Chloroflexota bacterium]
MGIKDRLVLEELTSRVIKSLEMSVPLPGMEDLMQVQQHASSEPNTTLELENISMTKTTTIEPMSKPVEAVEAAAPAVVVSTPKSCKLTENAVTVLRKRYLRKDATGAPVETPEEMFRRVAKTVAAADLNYDAKADVSRVEEDFYQVMIDLEFLPNSPTLMNAGRELGQLSACFVLPVEDTMESIFDAVKYTALIHKSGGGTGFAFSRIRPRNDRVGSTGGVASGPISFMRAVDTATDVIKQGGMRRGANMAILRIDHPDVLDFISAKESNKALTNFNLSVAIDSAFMKAVESDAEYDLINPRDHKPVRKLKAREVIDKIVDMAWRTGDPGIVFIDRINRDNPTPKLGRIEATNPCGEQPLLPFESCNLGSVNLANMLLLRGGKYEIDWSRLAKTVRLAVHFLDNVIDVNRFPLKEIAEKTRLTRKIGLGVMGFADMLIQLRVPYDSPEGEKTAEKVMGFIDQEALKASTELAAGRGVFPAFQGSIYDLPGGPRLRNAARTTIAPTGTVSIIAGCSSGIEPLFALSYTRNILEGAQLIEVNPYFEETARNGGFYSAELMRDLARGMKIPEKDGAIPDWVKNVFRTAHDIAPDWHVKIQSAFQRHTNNAVSKTVNLPHDCTREDVAHIYMMAFQEDLKGITVYRDRSKDAQVLSVAPQESAAAPEAPAQGKPAPLTPRKRPKVTHGATERVTTGCGHLYVTVNSDEQGICEVFTSLGKAGGCSAAQLEATGRLISLTLRSGVDVGSVVKHLRGIRCPSISWEDGKSLLSCADAIAGVLERHQEPVPAEQPIAQAETKTPKPGAAKTVQAGVGQCPDCSSSLVFQEGCYHCPGCGFTRC